MSDTSAADLRIIQWARERANDEAIESLADILTFGVERCPEFQTCLVEMVQNIRSMCETSFLVLDEAISRQCVTEERAIRLLLEHGMGGYVYFFLMEEVMDLFHEEALRETLQQLEDGV